MFALQLLTATIVAALVSAFQPGADYDLYKTTNLYNCTGRVPVSNVTARNAVDTLPQIPAGQGWEQWTLLMHGTVPIVLRWNQGDPSASTPSSAHVDVLVDLNGTTVQGIVPGNLSYTHDAQVNKVTIRDNVLAWDADALWYNISVHLDGYHLTLDSFSATRDAFHPNVAFHNGLLDPSGPWFASVPLIRGHVTGHLCTPTGDNITLDGLTVLRHTFAAKPLPDAVDSYIGGIVWGHSTTFYDTHVFYRTEKANGTAHDAAYLGRSIPMPGKDGVFASTWVTYAVTDDILYTLAVDDRGFNASLSGCGSEDVPFQFNTSAITLLGALTDVGGGMTTYWMLNGTTSAVAPNGTVAHGTMVGFFEVYEVPC